jgi:hypothetical protein
MNTHRTAHRDHQVKGADQKIPSSQIP